MAGTACIQRRVFVSGRVQGVGFRRSTQRKAMEYPGLKGYVRNLPDGRVEAVFCGEESLVLKMVSWCSKGPAFASVKAVEVIEEVPDPGLGPFEVAA